MFPEIFTWSALLVNATELLFCSVTITFSPLFTTEFIARFTSCEAGIGLAVPAARTISSVRLPSLSVSTTVCALIVNASALADPAPSSVRSNEATISSYTPVEP